MQPKLHNSADQGISKFVYYYLYVVGSHGSDSDTSTCTRSHEDAPLSDALSWLYNGYVMSIEID